MSQSEKIFDPRWNLVVLCLASFVIVSGFSIILPFFPIYANDILYDIDVWGLTLGIALQIGMITAASKLVQVFLTPAFGELSDEIGRKPLIVLGMTLYTLLMVGYGFATSFALLLGLRALQGIGSASVWTIGEALVVDTSKEEEKGRNLGYYMFSMLLGITLGPFVGYGIFSFYNSNQAYSIMLSYRLTFITVGIFGVISILIVLFLLQDPSAYKVKDMTIRMYYWISIKSLFAKIPESPKILMRIITDKTDYRNQSMYSLYIVALVNGFGSALLLPISALFLEEYYLLDAGSIALIIGVIGLLSLFGAPLGGVLSDRFGEKTVVWISGVIGGLVMFCLGVKWSIFVLAAILTFRRFLFSILSPSFRSLQSTITPEEVRGREFGVVQAFNNLGSAIGPIVGGLLYDIFASDVYTIGSVVYFGTGIVFAFSGLLAILASLVILIFVRSSDTIMVDINSLDTPEPQTS